MKLTIIRGPLLQQHPVFPQRLMGQPFSFVQTLTATAVAVTGTLVRQVNLFRTAISVVVTASVVKQVSKLLTATNVLATASLVRQANKLMTATTVLVTSNLRKQVNKFLTATSVVVTASLATLKVILKALSATVVLSASLSRQIAKTLVANSIVTGALDLVVNIGTAVVNTISFLLSTMGQSVSLPGMSRTSTLTGGQSASSPDEADYDAGSHGGVSSDSPDLQEFD